MSTLNERKIEFTNAIEAYVESMAGPEFFMSTTTKEDGTYEITIAIPREAFCIKDEDNE